MKLHREEEGDDGWSRWSQPVMDGYKLACCDCGLVHDVDFRALKVIGNTDAKDWQCEELPTDRYRVELRAKRNNRSTGQVRRSLDNGESQ